MKDYQKNRVYRWENENLPTGGMVKFDQAQTFVNYIWKDMGLSFPPVVKPFDRMQHSKLGQANRLNIWLQPEVSMCTLIHEIAHSMTSNVYGESAYHGPIFVGVYVKLLQKYMHMDLFHLITTLGMSKVEIDIAATPIIED